MSNTFRQEIDQKQASVYQIRLQGHLGSQWADWFGGLTITSEENGETQLIGPVVDQAALFSVLKKVRDLGLPLISVMFVGSAPEDVSDKQNIINQEEHL